MAYGNIIENLWSMSRLCYWSMMVVSFSPLYNDFAHAPQTSQCLTSVAYEQVLHTKKKIGLTTNWGVFFFLYHYFFLEILNQQGWKRIILIFFFFFLSCCWRDFMEFRAYGLLEEGNLGHFFFFSYLHVYVSVIIIVILNSNGSDLKDTTLKAFISSYSLWVPSLVRSLMRLASGCVGLWVYRLCWVVCCGCKNLGLKMWMRGNNI